MNALILYDSFFGNTEQVAQAIADGLRGQFAVALRRVNEVQPDDWAGLDLLIVGSPTRAFRPTPALTTLLANLPPRALQGVKVATFDTRIAIADTGSRFLALLVNFFGYAAQPLATRLQKKAGKLIVPPAGFIVTDKEGPLKEGELTRAADWARQIMATFSQAAQPIATLNH